MIQYVRETLNPDGYHGRRKKSPFFEGWYYKLTDMTGQHAWAIIPGIFKGKTPEKSHCFVQVFNGQTGHVAYHTYALEEFHSSGRSMDIRVGPNRFTKNSISLHLKGSQGHLEGQLNFTDIAPWPVTLLSPGVMGWYAWAPFMQCYHGIVSLDHAIEGSLAINTQQIDFTGGRGYTEKDWGRSFPGSWIWFQTNHFDKPDTSLMASVAIIPWLHTEFLGFLIGLWHDGKLHRFTTYTGARLEDLKITKQNISLVIRDARYCLELSATRSSTTGLLQAPTQNGMDRQIEETLNAKVDLCLYEIDKPNTQPILSAKGHNAGLETVGDLDKLVEMWAKGSR